MFGQRTTISPASPRATSSQEVENAVFAYPAVNDVAAVAVPGEHGEDDVLIVVAPKPGTSIDPLELFEYLKPRMVHFMCATLYPRGRFTTANNDKQDPETPFA